jgi:UPF0716 protein FxsA
MRIWFVIFFLTPLVEIYVLISAGGVLGVFPTVFLVMLTAVIGISLLRQQGLSTLTRGMQKMQRGELPAQEMAEGLLLAIAGALLLTPGFVTDGVGFFLLTPVLRAGLIERIQQKFDATTFTSYPPDSGPGGADQTPHQGKPGPDKIIEGEFERRP